MCAELFLFVLIASYLALIAAVLFSAVSRVMSRRVDLEELRGQIKDEARHRMRMDDLDE